MSVPGRGAVAELGHAHQHGAQHDPPQAGEDVALEQGHIAAQKYLGILYAEGRVGRRDAAEAVRWIRVAAEQGHPDAQNCIGVEWHFPNS